MNEETLASGPFNETYRIRAKEASLRVIRLFQQLPRSGEAAVLGRQLLRSATSVAANFRAACWGHSPAEWYAKLRICVEKADETLSWLELLGDAEILPKHRLQSLENEYIEILAVLAIARKKAKPKER